MGVWRLYWYLVAYVCGILSVYLSPLFIVFPILMLLFWCCRLCVYRRVFLTRVLIIDMVILVSFLPFGMWRTHCVLPTPILPETRTNLAIRVINEPLPDEKWVRFDVRLDSGERLKAMIKRATFDVAPFDCGDELRFDAQLFFPDPPTNPGQFDYGRYLISKGISGQCRVELVHSVNPHFGNLLRELAIRARKMVHAQIRSVLPIHYDNLYIGLLFGDYGVSLLEEWEDQFRILGLTHILVVSGAQVVLLNQILSWIIGRFMVPVAVECALIWFSNCVFVLVTGAGASIVRAALMCSIWYGLKSFRFRTQGHFVLAFSVLLLTLVSPLWVIQLGAILSVLACISLMVVAPLIRHRLPKRWPRWIQEMVAVSISPFIVTTPIIWHSFQTLSLISVVANMIALWVIELIVMIGFFGTFLGLLWSGFAHVLHSASYAMMVLLVWFAATFSKIPMANMWVSSPFFGFPLLLYPIYGLACFGAILKRPRLLRVSGLLTALFFAYGLVYAIRPLNEARVTVLDVGQGDAILIESPNRTRVLIDTGARYGKSTIATRTIIPALRAKGINRLDLIIITHWDADHAAGLADLVAQFPTTTILHNGRFPEQWRSLLDLYPVGVLEAKAGQLFELGRGMQLKILAPLMPDHNESKNDRSIVMQFLYGESSLLFTGDLESTYERQLVSVYGDDLKTTVLKLGHHGSKTSTTAGFLNAVQPQIALLSVGKDNRYGHPHSSVTTRLEEQGVLMYRTDTQGAITIRFSLKGFLINSYLVLDDYH